MDKVKKDNQSVIEICVSVVQPGRGRNDTRVFALRRRRRGRKRITTATTTIVTTPLPTT